MLLISAFTQTQEISFVLYVLQPSGFSQPHFSSKYSCERFTNALVSFQFKINQWLLHIQLLQCLCTIALMTNLPSLAGGLTHFET